MHSISTAPTPTQSTVPSPPVRSAVPSPPVRSAAPSLSSREVEVLLAWFAAESKTDTAKSLYISACTVNTHLTRIRAKYEAVGRPAQTKAALFARAIQDGFTSVEGW